MERDVWVLGRIGYDLHAVERDRPLPEVEHFSRHVGGSSANITVGLSRLGLKVGIISAVGDDLLADYLIGFLGDEGVDTRFVRRVAGYSTSLCLTEVSLRHGFRQVFYRQRPADSQVTAGEEEMVAIRAAQMFVTNGTSLAESPSREATLAALRQAHDHGVRTVFDMDYRDSSWPSAEHAGQAARATLASVDVVLANETELQILAGPGERRDQVRRVLDAGASLVVCKLGERGVEAHTREQVVFAAPQEVPVVSTIGAGDGFAAGFLHALSQNRSLDEALWYGNAAAAIVVSRVSCSDAMPYRAELEKRCAETSPAGVVNRGVGGAVSQTD